MDEVAVLRQSFAEEDEEVGSPVRVSAAAAKTRLLIVVRLNHHHHHLCRLAGLLSTSL